MPDGHRTASKSSIVPLASNEHHVELSDLPTNSDNRSIGSTAGSSNGKHNFIIKHFQTVVKKFDFLNVEKRGIERISPEDRTDSKIINTAMIWVGANVMIPCFATGILGPAVFKLSLYNSFIAIIIFNLIGVIPVAAMACFGPASGLRTMVFSRYSWGYYGASILSFINVITSLGWAAINSITGAQALRVVSNDTLSLAVGIIIVAFISMVVPFVGYKWIYTYERYSWIPVFIAFCIVAGVGGKYFTTSEMISINATTSNISNSRLEISRILSFGAPCFGTAFIENPSPHLYGNILSLIPIQLLGAAAYTGIHTNDDWSKAYEKNNAGGLLGANLSSLGGFGKFLLVLFALSTVACNIPNIYSLSLSAQVVAPLFKRIARCVYTVIGTVIYTIFAIITASQFNDVLTSFSDVVSYWFSLFIVVVFEEHLIFRRCSFKNYDFNIWNNRKALPISLAAILSGLIGIVGIGIGMSQTWFSGPVAKAIIGDSSEKGADVGFEFGLIFTAITFPLFRFIELRFLKR